MIKRIRLTPAQNQTGELVSIFPTGVMTLQVRTVGGPIALSKIAI